MGTPLPTGTVTFLFTDIEGSTKLAQQFPDAMPALLLRHHDILSRAIKSHQGFVFRIAGDSFAAAFQAAGEALDAALEWGLENDLELALRIILALRAFWMRHGYESEACNWLNEALARQNELPDVEEERTDQQLLLSARAWEALTFLLYNQGDSVQAIEAADKCELIAHRLGEKSLIASVLVYKGTAMLYTGVLTGIDEIATESIKNARESGDRQILALAFSLEGQTRAMLNRDLNIARVSIKESTAVIGPGVKNWGTIMSIGSLGMTAKYFGEYEEARRCFQLCLPLFEKIGDLHRANMMRSELAHLDRLDGNYNEAEAAYRDTIRKWQRLGHRAAVANQLECFAFSAKANGLARRAVRLLGAADALREQIHIEMTPFEKIEYSREIEELKAQMPDGGFSASWAEGRSLSMEQAIQVAVSRFQ